MKRKKEEVRVRSFPTDSQFGGRSAQGIPRRDGPDPLLPGTVRDIQAGYHVRMCYYCGVLTRWSRTPPPKGGNRREQRTSVPVCTRCGKPAD